ncbi:NADH:flavin oxidoreductase [Candidatus Scalindua japonica]|uniref:NADH:flavin oxidoreductase n=2 Tax=Candidatus Scalindua japonica TaxID=1284222 RepID=A0A286U432_9BACT|nr:NADH:flavin oxidoreductase [Candidatus Scalindua japonica]
MYQDQHGSWHPYNDYDICIVANRKALPGDVKKVKERLARKVGINWIDLGQFSPEEMRCFCPSILNYDFKYASKVIYGDQMVLDLIPEIKASALPMKEAQILFFTRLYTLLGSLDKNGLDQNLRGETSRFFRNQMAKAILAIVDVLLLAKGAYDASYCKRVEKVNELYPEKKEFLVLGRWALEEKLRPQSSEMSSQEIRRMYQSVHYHYFIEMYNSLSLHFCKNLNDPQDIEFCMKWQPLSFMKRLYWFVRYCGWQVERQISIQIAQCYIAAAWNPENIIIKNLNRGIALLRTVDPQLSTEMNWDEARLQAVRLRMEA